LVAATANRVVRREATQFAVAATKHSTLSSDNEVRLDEEMCNINAAEG